MLKSDIEKVRAYFRTQHIDTLRDIKDILDGVIEEKRK